MTFLDDLLLGTARRRIDHIPHTDPDSSLNCVVHVLCDPGEEHRVRARIAQALTGYGARPTDASARCARPGSALLEATFAAEGPLAAPLAQLVTHVWLDPAVTDLHWHLDTPATGTTEATTAFTHPLPTRKDRICACTTR
ncbi:hypothetical protein ACFQ6V_09485 [Streptomyces roseifaciens]